MQFDKLINLLLERNWWDGVETYNTTPRQILQNRYGKNTKSLIDAQRAYTKQTANTPLAKNTQQKYSIPDYSRQQLDQKTPVRVYDFPDYEKETGGLSTYMPKDPTKPVGKNNPVGKEVHINSNPGIDPFKTAEVTRAEFKNKSGIGTSNVGGFSDNQPQYADFNISDIVGHENTHSLQPEDQHGGSPDIKKIKSFSDYTTSAPEAAAWMSNLKYWYYRGTGKTLPANASKQEMNEFIKYWNNEKKKHPDEWEAYQPVIDMLKTPEGEHLFRRTVAAPKNGSTIAA